MHTMSEELNYMQAKKQNILDNIKLSLQNKPFTRCFLIIQEHKENFICLPYNYDTRVSHNLKSEKSEKSEKAIKKFSQFLERENITPNYEICIITS
jgi:hypothetical protein